MRIKKGKKCFAETCEECNWFRYKQMEKVENGKPTGVNEMVEVCLHEYYFDALNFLMGSYDGLQRGMNEARNRSMETKDLMIGFGQVITQTIKGMGLEMVTLQNIKDKPPSKQISPETGESNA